MSRRAGLLEQLLRARATDHPDRTWLRFGEESYSSAQTLSLSQRAANGLLELGLRPGDRLALLLRNRPEFLFLCFGASMVGIGTVPVNVHQRGPTLAHMLRDAGVVAAVVESDLLAVVEAVREEAPALRTLVVVGDAPPGSAVAVEHVLGAPDREPDAEPLPNDPGAGAAMLYTSGTTGPPKGVVSTGPGAGSSLAPVLAALGVSPGETLYTSLPLYHGNALFVSALGSLLLDARLALGTRFRAATHFEECRRAEAVEFNTLGGMISLLLAEPPGPSDRDHRVRTVLSAGCPPDRWRAFEERFGVHLVEWYGMVDAPGFLLNDVGRVGSMGRPVGGTEFAVVDDQDRPLGPGQVGELVFRPPGGQTSSYHNLPDATAQAWRGGYFHTGDLACYDEDGFFYYRGRKKESIRRLGENISAWEIETVVAKHERVAECAAHAVPSELGEDEVKLCVAPKPGAELDPAELVAFLEGKVASYALPRYVEVLPELPHTGTQRVAYAALRARGVTPQTWDRRAQGAVEVAEGRSRRA